MLFLRCPPALFPVVEMLSLAVAHSEDGSGRAAVRTGTGVGCVCERERRGIDDTVITDQRIQGLAPAAGTHRQPSRNAEIVWDDARHVFSPHPLEENIMSY